MSCHPLAGSITVTSGSTAAKAEASASAPECAPATEATAASGASEAVFAPIVKALLSINLQQAKAGTTTTPFEELTSQ
jgi:hypothetical protein